ncbi:hypothetical protein [Paenibacillus xylanivorans]|uniref:Uncharacterized protein n=1 Tax=Paenibacillus xylanivorans TaxID=1705561 RepID=A0A0M9BLL2_9BACL|nr:hypothetical protein [Paenibacillus xylanivorans]KOY14820.1 hypothetical protein AMS66_18730 [Paenibacillus xylanivorans]
MMRVTTKMIDKQLRIKGKLIDLLMKSSHEEKWLASMRKIKKRSDVSAGKDIEGLTCSEEWIPRKSDGSKIRVRIYKSLHPTGNAPGFFGYMVEDMRWGTPSNSGKPTKN